MCVSQQQHRVAQLTARPLTRRGAGLARPTGGRARICPRASRNTLVVRWLPRHIYHRLCSPVTMCCRRRGPSVTPPSMAIEAPVLGGPESVRVCVSQQQHCTVCLGCRFINIACEFDSGNHARDIRVDSCAGQRHDVVPRSRLNLTSSSRRLYRYGNVRKYAQTQPRMNLVAAWNPLLLTKCFKIPKG